MEHASKQRVGLVPARYLDHPDVGVLELGVLTVLSIHADRTGLSWPSQTTIATKLKINRSTANSVLAKLVSLGLVVKGQHPNPKIRVCTYQLPGHETLLDGFLGSLHHAVDELPATVADGDTEHPEHLHQESLSLGRASAPEGDIDLGDAGTANPTGPSSPGPLDDGWTPSHADLSFATTARPDLSSEDVANVAQKFVTHYRGQPLPDPSSIFRCWIRKEIKRHDRSANHASPRLASAHDTGRRAARRGGAVPAAAGQARFDAWARAALARRAGFPHVS
jgi:DNA-binding MarR family transcriptional regulator